MMKESICEAIKNLFRMRIWHGRKSFCDGLRRISMEVFLRLRMKRPEPSVRVQMDHRRLLVIVFIAVIVVIVVIVVIATMRVTAVRQRLSEMIAVLLTVNLLRAGQRALAMLRTRVALLLRRIALMWARTVTPACAGGELLSNVVFRENFSGDDFGTSCGGFGGC